MIHAKRMFGFLVCVLLLTSSFSLAGEADDLKKKIMFDQKKLIVLENIELTEAEGEIFWPVYAELQEHLFKTSEQLARLILAYAASYQTLTDEQAAKVVDQYFTIQSRRLATMDTYMEKLLKGGLPAKKVLRYLQVENKLESITRFEIANEIPLAQ